MLSVIIPTYKKTEMLLANLKQNLSYLKDCEIIIVNDDPEKSIKDLLREFPVLLIEHEKNLGFGDSINSGVKQAKYSHLMLLNSDVILHDDSFKKALDHFKEDRDLFAVSFAQKEKDGQLVGKNAFFWARGLFHHKKARDFTSDKTAWAEGGACVIDREKFLNLDGFDSLYSPFYWEDIDLSYCAWKAGYKVVFDADIEVVHHHESTISSFFSKNEIKKIAYRNQFIFIWKNITDPSLFASHLLLLLPNLLYYFFRGEFSHIIGFLSALGRVPIIAKKKTAQKKHFVRSDIEVLRLTS